MKISAIKTKILQVLLLCACSLLSFSCDNHGKRTAIGQELLTGSWKDTSPSALHFTLFKDGTARSDNMKTLLYKNWSVKDNQITFTVESIGNGTSSTDKITYIVEKLTDKEMVLRSGESIYKYKKK
ncbi:MAG: lipocalin family protein [Bacteroidales bacterium]|nr:lipocalin family protein [Bacteroidales bacterium]